MLYPAKEILAIDVSPFGQSLALVPAMRSLRKAYPATRIVAAASNGTCELLAVSGDVDETIPLGVIKFPDEKANGLKRFFILARRSRSFNFDLILDFSPRLETQIASRLVIRAHTITSSKLPRTLEKLLELGGVRRSASQPPGQSPSQSPSKSYASSYTDILSQTGIENHDIRLRIPLPEEQNARFESRLSRGGSRGGELIALLYAGNPASNEGWPIAAFGEIASRLTNNFGARVIAADEPSDDSFTNSMSGVLPPGSIKLSRPYVLELTAAIARASIVITDDPGIARVGAEFSTPVIEVGDAFSTTQPGLSAHRIAKGSTRARVSTDEVYEIACEMIHDSRSPSLFHHS